MKKWTFRGFVSNPFGKLILCFGIGLIVGGLWYLMSNNYIIIKW